MMTGGGGGGEEGSKGWREGRERQEKQTTKKEEREICRQMGAVSYLKGVQLLCDLLAGLAGEEGLRLEHR